MRSAALPIAAVLAGAGLWFAPVLGAAQIWLLGAGLVGLVGVMAELFVTRAPDVELQSHLQAFCLWAAPGLLLAAGLWLAREISGDLRPALALGGAAVMGLLLMALSAGGGSNPRSRRIGRFGVSLILFLSAFALFALIYHSRTPGPVAPLAAGAVAFLAGLELMRPRRGDLASWSLVALPALVIAETAWGLGYWPAGGPLGGVLLLLVFYVCSGLGQVVREGGIDRRALVEYGAVGVSGFVAVLLAVL